jgi:hypothetical protein
MSVLIFASFFTRLAPCRKRQRSQARLRDSDSAFNTGSVRTRLEPDERGVDAPHRLCPHLEQREINVSLTVGAERSTSSPRAERECPRRTLRAVACRRD